MQAFRFALLLLRRKSGDYARVDFGRAGCVCVANGQGGAGRVFEAEA